MTVGSTLAHQNAEAATERQAKQLQQITQLDASVNKLVKAFLDSPEATKQLGQLDITKRRAIAELREDPVVRQRLAQPTLESLAALGIPNPVETLEATPPKLVASLQGEVLVRAANAGQPAKVQQLLDAGVPVDYREDTTVITPLIYAVQGADYTKRSDPPSHVEVVELLLKRGADPNARYGTHQMTAINFAGNHPEITRLLLDAGADINDGAAGRRFTPIMSAAVYGNVDTVKLLLARGARTEIKSTEGETVCEVAKRGKKPEQVLAVLRAKAICGH